MDPWLLLRMTKHTQPIAHALALRPSDLDQLVSYLERRYGTVQLVARFQGGEALTAERPEEVIARARRAGRRLHALRLEASAPSGERAVIDLAPRGLRAGIVEVEAPSPVIAAAVIEQVLALLEPARPPYDVFAMFQWNLVLLVLATTVVVLAGPELVPAGLTPLAARVLLDQGLRLALVLVVAVVAGLGGARLQAAWFPKLAFRFEMSAAQEVAMSVRSLAFAALLGVLILSVAVVLAVRLSGTS
ncbi:MAG: hypothetical protein K6U89_16195 [Chloroflexi bacterium]|nr:hypothetical protein [Chloroflexota bacterium]